MFLGFRPLPPSPFSTPQLSLASMQSIKACALYRLQSTRSRVTPFAAGPLEQVLRFPPSAAGLFQTTCTANVSLASLLSCEACATYPLQSILIRVTPFAAISREQASGDTLPPSTVFPSGSSALKSVGFPPFPPAPLSRKTSEAPAACMRSREPMALPQ